MALTVAKLLARKADVLGLSLLTDESTTEREITTDEVVSPGLVLAGFSKRFDHNRAQVIGETEIAYLASLTAEGARDAVERFLSFDVPVIFVTGDVAGTDAERFLEDTGCRWLAKPFRLGDLLRAVRDTLA